MKTVRSIRYPALFIAFMVVLGIAPLATAASVWYVDDDNTTGVCVPTCDSYLDCRDTFEDPDDNKEYCMPNFLDDTGDILRVIGACGRHELAAKQDHGDECGGGVIQPEAVSDRRYERNPEEAQQIRYSEDSGK